MKMGIVEISVVDLRNADLCGGGKPGAGGRVCCLVIFALQALKALKLEEKVARDIENLVIAKDQSDCVKSISPYRGPGCGKQQKLFGHSGRMYERETGKTLRHV